MNVSDDIERFRSAEQTAQDIVAQAKAEAQRIRKEAAARVEELNATAENDLLSVRKRIQDDVHREVEAVTGRSRERIASAHKEVGDRLAANKTAAVKRVIEELTRVP